MKNIVKISILSTLIICACFVKTVRWDGASGHDWKEQFNSCDAQGYYAYLPQLFIKHDLSNQDISLRYVNKTDKGQVIKYFVGTPLMWSPFFGITWVVSRMQGENSDGYTELFKKMISIAALFWLFVGLLSLAEVLRMLKMQEKIIAVVLLLIVFGTNLFYYAVIEPTMSHLYSFSMLSIFLCFGMKFFRTGKIFFLVLTSFAFGLSALIRPTNILFLICLLPFISGGFGPLKEKLLKTTTWLIILPILFLMVFLQCGAWYLQTGHWFVVAYTGEGFYFLQPKILQVLFSFKKGWFVYTPLVIVCIPGLFVLYKKNKIRFFSILSALFICTYTIAAWWCWSFADSFGHRGFIDIYAVVAILLGFVFSFLPQIIHSKFQTVREEVSKQLIGFLCMIFLCLNLLQTYQFYKHVMHYNSMDWNRYKYIFLRTDEKYINCLGGSADLWPYCREKPQLLYNTHPNFSGPRKEWKMMPAELLNGKPALHFAGAEYGALLELRADKYLFAAEKLFAEISVTRFELQKNGSQGAVVICDIIDSLNNHFFYRGFSINDFPADREGDSRTFHYTLEIKKFTNKNQKLLIYIWNKEKRDFYLQDISVKLYRVFS